MAYNLFVSFTKGIWPAPVANFFCSLRSISKEESITGLRNIGLPNIGNTCYMNAVLQCLCCTDELKEHFSNSEFEQCTLKAKQWCIIHLCVIVYTHDSLTPVTEFISCKFGLFFH